MITRFNVPELYKCTRHLVEVANNKKLPDLIIYNANILSTYTDRILNNKPVHLYNRGNHSRDYTYIDDVVDALIKLITKKPKNTF